MDSGTLDGRAGARLGHLTNAGSAPCAEFRQDFRAYLGSELGGSRRMLVEDISAVPRLSRADRRDEGRADGHRHAACGPPRRWVRWGALAAAAALFLSVLYLGRDSIDAMMAPGGPRATVVSANGGLYRLAAATSARSAEREADRAAPPSANTSRSARARELMRCCGSPTNR